MPVTRTSSQGGVAYLGSPVLALALTGTHTRSEGNTMSGTAFQIDQVVESRINEQGLTEGEHYYVADVIERHLAFGTFVTYVLEDDKGDRYAVGNGHLVLALVNDGA